MNIKPIKTKKDYDQAMLRLETLFDAKKGTSKGDELEILSLLIEKYEVEKFPIGLPDPIEAIKIRMSELGLKNKDLVPVIGYDSRVSEVLNGKRKLTLDMIRALNKMLHLPLEVLVQDY